MTNDTIPLEAGIEDRAISLTKGCYVGQEIIIRVLHRGQGRVARRLVGLTLDPMASVPGWLNHPRRRSRDWPRHQRCNVARAGAADCAGVCAPGFRGAWDSRYRRKR